MESALRAVQLLLLHEHRSCGVAIDAAGGGLAAPAAALDEDDSDSQSESDGIARVECDAVYVLSRRLSSHFPNTVIIVWR